MSNVRREIKSEAPVKRETSFAKPYVGIGVITEKPGIGCWGPGWLNGGRITTIFRDIIGA